MNELFSEMGAHLLSGRTEELKGLTEKALEDGLSPKQILDEAMMPAMSELGARFSRGEAYLPELLLAADTMKTGALEVLRPVLIKGDIPTKGTILLGTVAGDIHDLGKNLVKMMLEGAGFTVTDLGINVMAEAFVDAYKPGEIDLIGLSSLLTNTMEEIETIIQKVRALYPEAKFIIGGAPITQEFADQVRANGYAADAHQAVKVAEGIIAA